MKTLSTDIIDRMNSLGADREPFLFLFDFELKRPLIYRLSDLPSDIKYTIGSTKTRSDIPVSIDVLPESFEIYKWKFDYIQSAIQNGDSYLLNLTARTPILLNTDLQNIYDAAFAKYKLKFKEEFVCFSPEPFVKIEDNQIWSYPMKGTIDATIPGAANILTTDSKELAEHYTIVDLIRNDLSSIATNVRVDRFRYTETVETHAGALLQQSTAIVGDLPADWHQSIGHIFSRLLPAGSISGAPKPKTVDLLRQAEGMDRGYYTGIFGIFDGTSIDSGVMIRFIEQDADQYYFRSGGGITHQSIAEDEYDEMIKKIYVPILRKHSHSQSADSTLALSQPEAQ